MTLEQRILDKEIHEEAKQATKDQKNWHNAKRTHPRKRFVWVMNCLVSEVDEWQRKYEERYGQRVIFKVIRTAFDMNGNSLSKDWVSLWIRK